MTEVFGRSKSQIKSGFKPEKLPPLLPCLSFLRLVVAPPFFTFLAPLAGNTKSKNWTSVPFQESCPHVHERTWPHNGAFHVLNWSFPPGGRSGLGPKSGLVFSCSHSGNSSKLSTRSGRVKLLKVTGGIRGRDWVLTHYAMMLREKCDGNSEMQSFHNAAGKEVMTSVMTDEQLTLLLLHLIYNL